MQPSSAPRPLHGNSNQRNTKRKRDCQPTVPFSLLKSHDAHFRSNSVWRCANEDQPLGQEVCAQDQYVAVWDRVHELVPGNYKVGEYKDYSSECKEATSLQQGSYHHCADQTCVYGYSYTENAWVGARDYADKDDCHKCQCAEYDHGQISFHFRSEFLVSFDLAEVPSDEIGDIHGVGECE